MDFSDDHTQKYFKMMGIYDPEQMMMMHKYQSKKGDPGQIKLENNHQCNKKCDEKCRKNIAHIYFKNYDPDNWEEFTGVINPDEIVIEDQDITVVFAMPLKKAFGFKYHSDTGFTRRQVVDLIYDRYKKIYEEEEKTSTIRVMSMDERLRLSKAVCGFCLMNRNRTNGKYGIHTDDMDSLVIELLNYNKAKKRITMFIGS